MAQLLGNNVLPGEPVTKFIHALCGHYPNIAELRFRKYVPTDGLSERLRSLKAPDSKWLTAAKSIALQTGTMLWSVVAEMVIKEGKQLPRDALIEALVHRHTESERTLVLTRREMLHGGLKLIAKGLRGAESLALCSEVRLIEGHGAHIPMLDFACAKTPANQSAICSMLREIGQNGVVVDSGKSYHFLGASILTSDEWIRFMGRALLFAPFIDTRFIGHRLLDGECTLRLTAKGGKIPSIEICI